MFKIKLFLIQFLVSFFVVFFFKNKQIMIILQFEIVCYFS